MKTKTKIVGVLVMLALVASFAAATERAAGQTTRGASQLQIGALDVITASDAGGGGIIGTASTIILIVLILAVIGLVSIF